VSTTAWEDVYRLHGERLCRFAYRLTGNPHDAADLVQETFVRALPRLDLLDADELNVGAYLLTTEKNLFLKSVERAKRLRPVDDVPEPAEPTRIEDDPERATLLAGQQEEVRRASAVLAPRQRLVLALRELEDRSYAEIGELVGVNENAVAQLISRARQRLREELRLVQVDRSKLPEECQSFLPQLSAHLDGQLEGARAHRTLAHLEACEHCQAALADMREASRRYRTLLPLLPDLFGRIDDALAANSRRTVRRRTKLAAGAAAATIALTGGAVATFASGEPEPVVVVAPTTVAQPVQPIARALPVTTAAAKPIGKRRVDRLFTEPGPGPGSLKTRTASSAPLRHAALTEPGPGPGSVKATPRPVAPAKPAPATAPTPTPIVTQAEPAVTETTTTATNVEEPAPVIDTTPPALTLPGGMSTQATSAAGAAVDYDASANDPEDGPVATTCAPASGTTFAIGTTTVTCTASDAHGNMATGSFDVTVAPLPQPDLAVTAVTGTSYTITNLGNAAAGVFTVAVQGAGVVTFAGLAPGATATRTLPCASIPRQIAVDPANAVAESDEANNTGRHPAC